MVFLTSLSLIDTGWLSYSNRDTSNRANSGSLINLKSVEITIRSSGNIDKTVPPTFFPANVYTAAQHACISVNPLEFTIRIKINSHQPSTYNYYNENDVSLLPILLMLPRTTGWKAMF